MINFKKLFSWNRKERDEKLNELSKKLDVVTEKLNKKEESIVRNRIKVGTNTVVVFQNGDSLNCEDPDNKFYNYCGISNDRQDINFVYNSIVNKEQNQIKGVITKDDLLILRNNKDFEIQGDKVYLDGIKIAIPDNILAEFISNREERSLCDSSLIEEADEFDDMYNRLIFFWAKLANSPVKDRDNVMTFLRDNDVRISKYGNIIAYRRVVSLPNKNKKRDINLQKFVEESLNKVKRWKKSAENYVVYKSEDFEGYKITTESTVSKYHFQSRNHSIIGKLSDIKNFEIEVEGKQLYTSSHNQGKYVFPIPSLYKLVDEEPNPNVRSCASNGLHNAAVSYNYSGFGDIPVVTLVNPAKAIAVPINETGKFRTSEMYIACINPNKHGVHIDESLIEEADRIYNDMTVEQLKEAFASKSLETLSIDDEHVPETSLKDVQNIVQILSNRVVNL